MHGSKKAGVVKTCKKWRMTRAQRFECYCREFKTDTGVNWKPVYSVNAEAVQQLTLQEVRSSEIQLSQQEHSAPVGVVNDTSVGNQTDAFTRGQHMYRPVAKSLVYEHSLVAGAAKRTPVSVPSTNLIYPAVSVAPTNDRPTNDITTWHSQGQPMYQEQLDLPSCLGR